MTSKKKVLAGKIAAISLAVPALILANLDGPRPRNTGGPGDGVNGGQTCARESSCHVGTANSGPGEVEIQFPSGFYIPGAKQAWRVRVNDPGGVVYGFQASARPASDSAFSQAGRFEAVQSNTFVMCESGAVRPAGGSCPSVLPVEFIEHNHPQESNEFNVEWTPPATDIGDVKVYVAGNAANGDGERLGDSIYTNEYTLSPLQFSGAPSIRQAQPVLQAFDNQERLSSGTWIQIYGENLAATTRPWDGAEFDGNRAPTSLDGVEVLVNGKNGAISYISPNQVNAQVPDDEAMGQLMIQIRHPGGTSNEVPLVKTGVTPAMQEHPLWNTEGQNLVVALHQTDPNNSGILTYVGPEGLVSGVSFRPAKPGEIVTLYVVGCGTSAAYPAGEIPSGAPPLAADYSVRIGGQDAGVMAVAAPGFIGLFQFNVTIPDLGAGNHQIVLTVDGVETGQSLFMNIGP